MCEISDPKTLCFQISEQLRIMELLVDDFNKHIKQVRGIYANCVKYHETELAKKDSVIEFLRKGPKHEKTKRAHN